MKLSINNISQKKELIIEVPSAESSIKDLTEELKKKYSLSPSNYKLIFNGQTLPLDDTKSLDFYKIDSESKLILEETKENKNKPEPYTEYKDQLKTLIEMGFEKEKAIDCINFAHGRTELAIEYYYNEIPNFVREGEAELGLDNEENESNEAIDNENDNDAEGNFNNDGLGPLIEKIAGIFKIISEEKKVSLNNLLLLLKNKNAYSFQIIHENLQDFYKMFSSPINDNDRKAYLDFKNKKKSGDSIYDIQFEDFDIDNNDEEEGDDQEEEMAITEEDKEVLKRLKDLGNFKEEEVIQAYLACHKNEELTADFLFEKIEGGNDNNQ